MLCYMYGRSNETQVWQMHFHKYRECKSSDITASCTSLSWRYCCHKSSRTLIYKTRLTVYSSINAHSPHVSLIKFFIHTYIVPVLPYKRLQNNATFRQCLDSKENSGTTEKHLFGNLDLCPPPPPPHTHTHTHTHTRNILNHTINIPYIISSIVAQFIKN